MAKGFNGSSSNFLNSDTVPLSVHPFTVSCMFKLNSLTTTQTLIYWGDKDQGNEEDCVILRFLGTDESSDAAQIQLLTADSLVREHTSGIGNTYLTTGVWAHAYATVFGTTRTVFLDGGGDTSVGLAPRNPVSPDRLAIGLQDNTSSSDPLDGDIAEVAIWSGIGVDIDGDPINKDALRYFSPLLVHPSDLVFYAPLIGGKDYDLVGGIDLTTNGTLTNKNHPTVRRPHY